MIFGSGISQAADPSQAAGEVVKQARAKFNGEPIDLAFFFVSPRTSPQYEEIHRVLKGELNARVLIGCTAYGVIGNHKEFEKSAALSLFLAHVPDTRIEPFYIEQRDIEAWNEAEDARRFFGISSEDKPAFFILPDPFSIDSVAFLHIMEQIYPGCPIVGGLASGASAPGDNVLFINDDRFSEGAVGISMRGNVQVITLVSQGCRPFGEPLIVTAAEENVISELAGRPAMEALRRTFLSAPKRDQELARHSLFLGCAVDEYKEKLGRGDFVIRNVISADHESGALAIGDYIHIGQTVQFHVRDAESAHEDLRALCQRVKGERPRAVPKGALVFSCNGRGENMFSVKDHDISTLHQELGTFPAAGFFCAGELGPIGTRNFLHGFTSSIVLFYENEPSPAGADS